MPALDLDRLAELEAAATKGPWERVPYGGADSDQDGCMSIQHPVEKTYGWQINPGDFVFSGWCAKLSDVNFTVALRNAAQELIALARRGLKADETERRCRAAIDAHEKREWELGANLANANTTIAEAVRLLRWVFKDRPNYVEVRAFIAKHGGNDVE
jgi:hypothetical protein